MVNLATQADVEKALGRALTTDELSRLDHALSKASGLFRREARRKFEAGTSTVRLKSNGGRIYLPEDPVTSVTSVVDDGGDDVEYELNGQWLTTCLSSAQFATVTYVHGGIPDLVRDAVSEVVARSLTPDENARAGVTQVQEGAGPFTRGRTFAAWAVGGQVLLSPEDKALAKSYRPKVPTAWVMRP